MAEVLSGCAVRAAIQQEQAAAINDEERHYLGAIKVRLETLFDLTAEPRLLEQLSDEIDWVNEKLGIVEK